MKKVLVTGSRGFVGKFLIKKLKQSGYKVFELSRSLGKDILDQKSFKNLPKIDIVFHLAAVVGYLQVQKDPFRAFKTNVLGTINVLEFCRQQKATLIFPSSYIYASPYNQLKKETDRLYPLNLYAQSKYLAELFCQLYAKKYKTKVVIIRVSNAYGPHQPKHYLIPLLLEKIIKGEKIILNHPQAKRDFIYIDDLLEAYLRLIKIKTIPGEVFNLSSGQITSLEELFQLIKKLTRAKVKVKFIRKLRKNEVSQNLMDNKKFCQATEWKPKISLQEGLKRIINLQYSRKIFDIKKI